MDTTEETVTGRTMSIRHAVFTLSWPAITEMSLQMMVGIFDTAMVGRLGAAALAAVGLGAQVSMIGMTVFAALSTGTTALVARHIGAGEERDACAVLRQSLILGWGLAIVVAVLTYTFADGILHLLFRGADEDVLRIAALYVRIVAFGVLPVFLLIIINGALRGAGDVKTPMRITALVNLFNLFLNYILIFGALGLPALGVRGAAIATALSQTIGGALILWLLFRGRLLIYLSIRDDYRPVRSIIKRIITIGIPAAMEQAIMRAGQVLYSMIVSSLGTVAYAAHQVALNAESLSFMPGFGFALAATTLVGQGLGAKDPELAEAGGKEAARMAVMVMSSMGVIFFLFSPWLVSLFTHDREVIETAATVLKIIGICQPALAIVMVLAGGLRGAGDTRTVMMITASGFFGLRVPIAYVLARFTDWGLVGAWMAMGLDLVFRAILTGFFFLRGRWKDLRI